ncbi:MAG: flippase-like domain-containing protein [wastewater metagenome]|nr:flippase-like domain-containing protein [Candidatus Loosdrechtia aerotolerans]
MYSNHIKLNRKKIVFFLGVIISIVCLWLFIRGIEWSLLKNALKDANYWPIIPTIILNILFFVARAIRWQGLISHIKTIPTVSLLSITCIGFMANNILPARVGEVLRPFLLYKKENIRFSTSVATVIVERIFDLLALIIFTVVVIALLPHPSPNSFDTSFQISTSTVNTTGEPIVHSLKKWIVVFAFAGVLTIASLFFVIINPDSFKKVLSRLCLFLPEKYKDSILGFYDSFVYGLKILEKKVQTLWIFTLSLIIWIISAGEIYILSFSFNIHLPFVAACLIATCLALAVALPQAPGYIGVFHIAILKSLNIFGIQSAAAQSYAIVLWLISILPSTVMGLLFLWREGISFREVVKLEEEIVDGRLEELEGIPKNTNDT